jgi:hypothetical protein
MDTAIQNEKEQGDWPCSKFVQKRFRRGFFGVCEARGAFGARNPPKTWTGWAALPNAKASSYSIFLSYSKLFQ